MNDDRSQICSQAISDDGGDISPILRVRYAGAPKFEDDPRCMRAHTREPANRLRRYRAVLFLTVARQARPRLGSRLPYHAYRAQAPSDAVPCVPAEDRNPEIPRLLRETPHRYRNVRLRVHSLFAKSP